MNVMEIEDIVEEIARHLDIRSLYNCRFMNRLFRMQTDRIVEGAAIREKGLILTISMHYGLNIFKWVHRVYMESYALRNTNKRPLKRLTSLRPSPSIFSLACGFGYLTIAKWVDITKLYANYLDGIVYEALKDTSYYGHLHVVRWLCKKFNIRKDVIIEAVTSPLRMACVGGSLRIMKWFCRAYWLTKEDVFGNQGILFHRHVQTELKQWLVYKRAVFRGNMKGFKGRTKWDTVADKQLEVILWLDEKYGFDPYYMYTSSEFESYHKCPESPSGKALIPPRWIKETGCRCFDLTWKADDATLILFDDTQKNQKMLL